MKAIMDNGRQHILQSFANAIKEPVIILDTKEKKIIINRAAHLFRQSVMDCHFSADCLSDINETCNKNCCFLSGSAGGEGCIVRQSLDRQHSVTGLFKLRFSDHVSKHTEISSTPVLDSDVIHTAFMPDPPAPDGGNGNLGSAFVDKLTGLPDIFSLQNLLSHEMARMKRNSKRLAIMFIDIQRFRDLNSFLGRDGGDKLLKEAASRIRNALRDIDMVARQGGDVFIAVVTDINSVQDILAITSKILKAISAPAFIDGAEIRMGACIGLSVFPEDGCEVAGLLKNADTALQKSKHRGANTFNLYKREMDIEAGEMMLMENSLHRALDNNEFVLYYQPQMETTTGKIVGVEALIRWNSPELGMVSPTKFIPLAERNGTIIDIGKWVIDTACRQARQWINQNFPDICISVNVSMKQFRDPGLISFILLTLKKYDLPARWLGIEITENSIMENPKTVISTMKQISELGIETSIDDFGTGYSSLGYLKNLPVGKLKIDKTFISNITRDEADAAIVRSVINLSHNFKLKVNAEGVESPEHVNFLRKLGCDELQGYFLSKPLPAEDFERLWHGMLLFT